MGNKNLTQIIILILLVAGLVLLSFRRNYGGTDNLDVPDNSRLSEDLRQIVVVADGLEIPWALAFLPDESVLVTERPGRVRLIDRDGNLREQPVAVIDEVLHEGEGGLLGVAVHPDFDRNRYVYLYYTYSSEGSSTLNKVVRYRFENNALTDTRTILEGIPGAINHNGGRLRFGPDRFLYVTTGDAGEPSSAQDQSSLAGKILRLTGEGAPAPGNPFNNEVYSLGHRNPQGLAWDSEDKLWSVEHGPTAQDELNSIRPGRNYGWPVITGEGSREGMENPVLHSGDNTWAPGGAAFLNGTLYFTGLRGNALYKVDVAASPPAMEELFSGRFGRLREVVAGPDDMLYLTTSNRDGRGFTQSGDDKIIRYNPNLP